MAAITAGSPFKVCQADLFSTFHHPLVKKTHQYFPGMSKIVFAKAKMGIENKNALKGEPVIITSHSPTIRRPESSKR